MSKVRIYQKLWYVLVGAALAVYGWQVIHYWGNPWVNGVTFFFMAVTIVFTIYILWREYQRDEIAEASSELDGIESILDSIETGDQGIYQAGYERRKLVLKRADRAFPWSKIK